jgi:hypothetical protein
MHVRQDSISLDLLPIIHFGTGRLRFVLAFPNAGDLLLCARWLNFELSPKYAMGELLAV